VVQMARMVLSAVWSQKENAPGQTGGVLEAKTQ
jgi:hypothetical protein